MHRRTRLCVEVGREFLAAGRLGNLVDRGADAFMIPLSSGDERWLPELTTAIREAERLAARPLAILVDMPESAAGFDPIMQMIAAQQLENVDFLVLSGSGGGAELTRLRESLRDVQRNVQCDLHLIAKFDRAQDFDDVEGLVGSAYGVMITESGLRSLNPSEAPIAQKTISRQCQVAAKPCLVARSALKGTNVRSSSELAEVFDLANLAFDHVDCVVLTETHASPAQMVETLEAADSILVAAEKYLELTDRPVRVGFGQPPNTAALAYAIRHILKMQEIAAVAVYSITGSTSRVIAKNWIDCPVLSFSSRVQTARMMCLYHGVISRHIAEQLDAESLLNTAGTLAKELEIAIPGDRIIVVSGHPNQTQDQANGFIVETIT